MDVLRTQTASSSREFALLLTSALLLAACGGEQTPPPIGYADVPALLTICTAELRNGLEFADPQLTDERVSDGTWLAVMVRSRQSIDADRADMKAMQHRLEAWRLYGSGNGTDRWRLVFKEARDDRTIGEVTWSTSSNGALLVLATQLTGDDLETRGARCTLRVHVCENGVGRDVATLDVPSEAPREHFEIPTRGWTGLREVCMAPFGASHGLTALSWNGWPTDEYALDPYRELARNVNYGGQPSPVCQMPLREWPNATLAALLRCDAPATDK